MRHTTVALLLLLGGQGCATGSAPTERDPTAANSKDGITAALTLPERWYKGLPCIAQVSLTNRRAADQARVFADAIHGAAAAGEVKSVRRILRETPQAVNAVSGLDKETPLQLAVLRNHREVVRILLQAGADVDVCSAAGLGMKDRVIDLVNEQPKRVREKVLFGLTPLHLAAMNNEDEVAEFLLSRGAEIDVKDENGGLTPLHWAVAQGHARIARSLLRKGADVNAFDDYQHSALATAAARGRLDLVKLLLAQGASVNTQCKFGWTPLHLAAGGGHGAIVELLVANQAKIDTRDRHGHNAHFHAVKGRHAWAAGYLLGRGAEIDFFSAIALGLTDRVAKFVSEDPELVRKSDGEGGLPLDWAVIHGQKAVAEILLNAKAPMTRPGPERETLLHLAAWHGRAEIAELLIARGAPVNARYGIQGLLETPLAVAAAEGQKGVVEVLLRHKARVDGAGRGPGGENALVIAAQNGHLAVVKVLLPHVLRQEDKQATLDAALQIAARTDRLEVVELLLAQGADVNAKGLGGGTPLGAACWRARRELLQLLLKRGAEPHVRGDYNRTLLHSAAQAGNRDAVELLLARGVDARAASTVGETPLHMAAEHGHKAVVELLLERGVDVNARDWKDRTPLALAVAECEDEVADLLRRRGGRE